MEIGYILIGIGAIIGFLFKANITNLLLGILFVAIGGIIINF